MSLLDAAPIYKPFMYPWAFQAWKTQQQIHWLPEEVPMGEDVKDWKNKLNDNEKHLLTQIFRFFTQADIEVGNCYQQNYLRIFKPVEVRMMLTSFANMETVHIEAYSYLLDTIGMPTAEYQAFMKYKEMSDKCDFFHEFNVDSKVDIAKTLAIFGGFVEGVQLFASFAMLLNFQRFGKMRGMGQIIAWSVRDETLHTQSIIKLFRTFVGENPEVWTPELYEFISNSCRRIITLEDAFIDLAFEFEGAIEGLTAQDVKNYIRYIANKRLEELGLESIYNDIKRNPLPWMEEILNAPEHTNFFENRVTEYARAATKGSWDQAFEIHK